MRMGGMTVDLLQGTHCLISLDADSKHGWSFHFHSLRSFGPFPFGLCFLFLLRS